MNPKKIQHQKPVQSQKLNKPVAAKKSGGSLFTSLDNFCTAHATALFVMACVLTVLFALLLFDVKMSNANDDSMYIESAWKFANDYHNFHVANAPLYPVFLSLFISAFGLNVIMLKSINIVFILLHIVFMFLAFRKRVSQFMLMAVLITTAVNSYFMYYASQTFTEAISLTLQGLFFYSAFLAMDKTDEKSSLNKIIPYWLFAGLIMFLFSMARNIAILAPVVLVLFFAVNRQFVAAGLALGSYLVFKLPFEWMKSIVWGNVGQYGGQSQILMQKDPYDASKGTEDMAGFISRFFKNADLYISKRAFQVLGFKDADSTETSTFLVIVVVVLLLGALYLAFKNKNKALLLGGLYASAFMAGTFIILQTQWDQTRLVMVYVPVLLLILFQGIYYVLKNQSSFIQVFGLLFVMVIFFSSFISTSKKASANFPILKENLAGNIYYGYTPDWVNYLQMSAYCADSLPAGSYVAARKAPMSFIYARGKQFYPVYNVFATDADSVLNTFKKDKVTHVIVASLRRNPAMNDGTVINTMQRLLYPVTQKYPQKLQLVKTIGDSEQAWLYKINY